MLSSLRLKSAGEREETEEEEKNIRNKNIIIIKKNRQRKIEKQLNM